MATTQSCWFSSPSNLIKPRTNNNNYHPCSVHFYHPKPRLYYYFLSSSLGSSSSAAAAASSILYQKKNHSEFPAVLALFDDDSGAQNNQSTMSSITEAKAAISASDVTFSVDDVENGRRNIDALNSTPKKDLIYESPYKLYAGNLTCSIKPEDLRNLFSQFGTVVSARVLQDRKAGKNRFYGFLSFSSPAQLEAAMALNQTNYRGRKIILREVKQN